MALKLKYAWLLVLIAAVSACQPGTLQDSEKTLADIQPEHDVPSEPLQAEPDENMDGRWVEYAGFKGYMVGPKDEGQYPGVVLIHEWWGLNQNIKNVAHDMAEEGFVVLAVDLYGGNVAENSDDARRYATEARENPEKAVEHMKSAVAYLKADPRVLPESIASMGYCFGGGMSMQLALNEEMAATVIYYGTLETEEEKLSGIDWPVLGVFGIEDTSIPVQTVNQFESSLNNLGIENEIYVYDGVGHAFANPSNAGHDPDKTEDAWKRTISFLNRHLKTP